MKKFLVALATVSALVACGKSASAAEFSMSNANQQDIWIAVVAWMTPVGSTNVSAKVHGGFWKLVPGEKRMFFDNAAYDINTAYAAVGYVAANGQFTYMQPKAGNGPNSQYFDLSLSNCTAFGAQYYCDVWAQVLGGILTSGGMRLHFDANSGVISDLKQGKVIRFVGQKTSTIIPNDIAQ